MKKVGRIFIPPVETCTRSRLSAPWEPFRISRCYRRKHIIANRNQDLRRDSFTCAKSGPVAKDAGNCWGKLLSLIGPSNLRQGPYQIRIQSSTKRIRVGNSPTTGRARLLVQTSKL